MSEELEKAKDSLLSAANTQSPKARHGHYQAALSHAMVALVEQLEKLIEAVAKGEKDG